MARRSRAKSEPEGNPEQTFLLLGTVVAAREAEKSLASGDARPQAARPRLRGLELEIVRHLGRSHPRATLAELAALTPDAVGHALSPQVLGRILRSSGLARPRGRPPGRATRKVSSELHSADRQPMPSRAERRALGPTDAEWAALLPFFAKFGLDDRALVDRIFLILRRRLSRKELGNGKAWRAAAQAVARLRADGALEQMAQLLAHVWSEEFTPVAAAARK